MNQNQLAMTTEQVAKAYGLKKGTLANLRWAKRGPKYYRNGRKILYKISDVEAWLFANPVLTIDTPEADR